MPKPYNNIKVDFLLIVELVLPFDSSTSMVREVKNLSPMFKSCFTNDVLCYQTFSFG